jgi:hypothetical protein
MAKDKLLAFRASEESHEGIGKLAEYRGVTPSGLLRDLLTEALVAKIVSSGDMCSKTVAVYKSAGKMLEDGLWKKLAGTDAGYMKYPETFDGWLKWRDELGHQASKAAQDYVIHWNTLHAMRPSAAPEHTDFVDLVKRVFKAGKKVVVKE